MILNDQNEMNDDPIRKSLNQILFFPPNVRNFVKNFFCNLQERRKKFYSNSKTNSQIFLLFDHNYPFEAKIGLILNLFTYKL